MSLLLYKLFLLLYATGVRIAAIGNKKARLWLQGRQHWEKNLQAFTQTIPKDKKRIWMHCASLGEFEQGRPVIEGLRADWPEAVIILSFFSPSGYEIRKNYVGAEHIMYLPSDSAGNAKKMIGLLQPDLVIWVKYEYWYHYLTQLKQQQIPVLLISAIFRPNQPFFAWYGKIWMKMLRSFEHIFVQNSESQALLQAHGFHNEITIAGDTRFDRVIAIASNFKPLHPAIDLFCASNRVMVAGSTWEDDEAEWVHYVAANPQQRYILVPHEIHPEHIQAMQHLFPQSILYSELIQNHSAGENQTTAHVLIVDHIGILSRLYHYADITYVGGGFGEAGIHNTLEAAVYGKPVIFGPEYEKFAEAKGLIDCGAAFSIENALELENLLNLLLSSNEKLQACGLAAKDFVYKQRGASQKILDYIQAKRLLTN